MNSALLNVLAIVQKPAGGSSNFNVVIVGIIVFVIILVTGLVFSNKK